MRDTIKRCQLGDNKAFQELKKDYNLKKSISSVYEDSKGNKFTIYLSKYNKNLKSEYNREVNIDGVKCGIFKVTKPKYETEKIGSNIGKTNMTKKPISVDEHYYMEWNYNDVKYNIHIGNESGINNAVQFAGDYINILNQK